MITCCEEECEKARTNEGDSGNIWVNWIFRALGETNLGGEDNDDDDDEDDNIYDDSDDNDGSENDNDGGEIVHLLHVVLVFPK